MLYSFAFQELMALKVHLGHSIWSSSRFAGWMIIAIRLSNFIINLYKHIIMFNLGLLFMISSVSIQAPLWFISSDVSIDGFMREAALNCAEFSVTGLWLNGLLSNVMMLFMAYRKLKSRLGILKTKVQSLVNEIFKNSIFSRYTWPRTVFLPSLLGSTGASKEALSAKVPAVSIVDSNVSSHLASVPVPGSDDGVETILYYGEFFSSSVLVRKFFNVSLWFFNVRSVNRVCDFSTWLKDKFQAKREKFFSSSIVSFDISSLRNKAASIFFSYNRFQDYIVEKMNISARNYFKVSNFNAMFFRDFVRKPLALRLYWSYMTKLVNLSRFLKKGSLSIRSLRSNFLIRFRRIRNTFHLKWINTRFFKKFLLWNPPTWFPWYRSLLVMDLIIFFFFTLFKSHRRYAHFVYDKYVDHSSFLDSLESVFSFVEEKKSIFKEKFYFLRDISTYLPFSVPKKRKRTIKLKTFFVLNRTVLRKVSNFYFKSFQYGNWVFEKVLIDNRNLWFFNSLPNYFLSMRFRSLFHLSVMDLNINLVMMSFLGELSREIKFVRLLILRRTAFFPRRRLSMNVVFGFYNEFGLKWN